MNIRIEKLDKLDLIIACAAIKTVYEQTERLIKSGIFNSETLKEAKRTLKETKCTYKKLDKILDKMDELQKIDDLKTENEVLKNGL